MPSLPRLHLCQHLRCCSFASAPAVEDLVASLDKLDLGSPPQPSEAEKTQKKAEDASPPQSSEDKKAEEKAAEEPSPPQQPEEDKAAEAPSPPQQPEKEKHAQEATYRVSEKVVEDSPSRRITCRRRGCQRQHMAS